jgi:hypothetical protein
MMRTDLGGRSIKASMLLTAGLAMAGAAQAEPICADRPGKATGTCTAPAGRVQIEAGLADWTLARTGGTRETALAIGETVFKYGLSGRSDIQLDVTPRLRTTSRADGIKDRASGFGDLVLLTKHRLTRDGAPVAVAVLPFVKIPTAKRALGNREWEGGVALPVQYSIPGTTLGIALTPELDRVADGDGSGHHLAMAQVASLGWQATPKLSLSGELWGQWDWDPAGTTRQISADGAIAYLARDDLQLDVGANFGLNRKTPDVEVYAGIATRF